jgi:hypothetical protein
MGGLGGIQGENQIPSGKSAPIGIRIREFEPTESRWLFIIIGRPTTSERFSVEQHNAGGSADKAIQLMGGGTSQL